jgi:N-acetylgalactosamine-6-sulfatase
MENGRVSRLQIADLLTPRFTPIFWKPSTAICNLQFKKAAIMSRYVISYRSWAMLAAALAIAISLPGEVRCQEKPTRPNVVLLLADDLGYGDLTCYGAPDVRTPQIDRLAKQGARFTQHYSNGPECSPTRTALMSGRYQQRVGGLECAIGTGNVGRYDDAIALAERHELGLPPELANLPRGMAEAGYEAVCIGKWHLGYEAKFNPREAGFSRFFGCLGGYVDYFTHRELSPLDVLYADREPVEREGHMTRLLADEALRFLDGPHERPFFLYVPFTAPHFPLQGPQDSGRPITAENINSGTREDYAELVEDLDAQIGRILARIDERELAENTVVIFASDNGATAKGRNLPLAGTKGTVMEGGIRVPLIVRWPGKIEPGSTSTQPCITFDLSRSLLALAGAAEPKTRPLDGIDILAHVAQKKADIPRTLFWRYRRGERTERAVRDGDLKLQRRTLDGGKVEEAMYDLAADPGEQQDLLARRGDDAARLRELLSKWEQEMGRGERFKAE